MFRVCRSQGEVLKIPSSRMKLLFDQNVSMRILPLILETFPASEQVFRLGLQEADDMDIWEYAKSNDYSIVTKDSDFHELVLLYGIPPKVIWLRCGNRTNDFIAQLILKNSKEILDFLSDNNSFCFEMY